MQITSEGRNLYEIKAGKVLRPDYLDNMKYLRENLPDVSNITVVFNGEGFPPTCINVREI